METLLCFLLIVHLSQKDRDRQMPSSYMLGRKQLTQNLLNFDETYIAKGTAKTNGLICLHYQQQNPCHHLLSTSSMDVLRCHVSESIRIFLVTLTNSCWQTIISVNRNYIHSGNLAFWDTKHSCTFYGTFMHFLFVSTFSAFIHYKHFFADLPSMLVTGCGPQEIEKYCLLLPGCNIVLDKVLEIFFIRYHREILFTLAWLQCCFRQRL